MKDYFIIDAFTFYNEFDLLEARLSILRNVVDVHLLVEGDKTFQGKAKPFYYFDKSSCYEKLYYGSAKLPQQATPWMREATQRQFILDYAKCIESNGKPVIVLLSDADEIPHPDAIRNLMTMHQEELIRGKVIGFHQDCYYYYSNLLTSFKWIGTKAQMLDHILNIQAVRDSRTSINMEPYGWHFSYLGGIDMVQDKIKSFSHAEYNSPAILNAVHDKIKMCKDLFGRKVSMTFIDKNCIPKEVWHLAKDDTLE